MASAERLDASLASFEAALAVEVAAVSRPPAPPREWHFRRSRGAAAAAGAAAPRSPLVFLPPLGVPCAAYFHRVAASLAAKGYSVLLPEAPPLFSVDEHWRALDAFFDALGLREVHLVGDGLGAALAGAYARRRPRRVRSLLCVTPQALKVGAGGQGTSGAARLFGWLPSVVLRGTMLERIEAAAGQGRDAEAAADFCSSQIDGMSGRWFAAQIALAADAVRLSAEAGAEGRSLDARIRVTTIEAMDAPLADKLGGGGVAAAAGANHRHAALKSGGGLLALSRAADLSMHAQIHLRAAGCDGGDRATVPASPASPAFSEASTAAAATPASCAAAAAQRSPVWSDDVSPGLR